MPIGVFRQTMTGLRARSADWRESAAIWAGQVVNQSDWHATEVYFHHDLCDDHAGPLSLELSEDAKFRLYGELGQHGLRLVALLHTHPRSWVDLSGIDRENQLSSRLGFWSLVIPWYAREPSDLETMGVHIRVEGGWSRLRRAEVLERVLLVG